jgi:ABC-type transport system involved in multi-copper enzyme maturation permease subunit
MSLLSLPANTLLAAAADGAPSSLQWNMTILVGLLALAALFAVLYTTRAGIIARATTKEAIRQPVFILMLVVALVILVINTFLPFFTLGDDVKMLKDCGLATILICSLLIAVWTASTSIADEIEGKTAMTLLSKPINRRQFIVGKYLGIVNAVMALLVPLSICLLALIYYKVGYDAKESSKVDPLHAERMIVVLQTVPGLLLILLEVAVLSAVSVAISTRLPMIVNLVTCFSIFVVGHLTPVLVQSDVFAGRLEFVQFMAMAIATVLPALELFNISAAVATDSVVPPVYLGTAAIYCAAYCTAAILLAFILFEDRDLA